MEWTILNFERHLVPRILDKGNCGNMVVFYSLGSICGFRVPLLGTLVTGNLCLTSSVHTKNKK